MTVTGLCVCSFNMKLRGPASGGLSQGDTEQKLKLETFSQGQIA